MSGTSLGDGVKNKLSVIATDEVNEEPTLLLRGADPLAARAARAYADAIEGSGGDTNMSRILRDHAKRMSQFSATRTVVYKPVKSLEEPATIATHAITPATTVPTTPSPYDASKRRTSRGKRI